jgi:hypothetical protein
MSNTFNGIDLSSIRLNNIDPMQNLTETESFKYAAEEINKRKLMETENNENLKVIVNYNTQLVSLNEKILKKINSLDDTLLFLNKVFIDKSKVDKETSQSHNALLVELIQIIDSKDADRLNKFTNGIAAPVIAGLIVEYLKMKLGIF